MGLRTSIPESLSAFTSWLAVHPVIGDSTFSADPLGDEGARDGAVNAYRDYLEIFDVPSATIGAVLVSLDRFYVFLGLGPVRLAAVSRP